jgi:hypothetical protein
MTNLYEEYASLEIQAKEIEAKKEQLRPHILQMMLDKGEKKIDTAVGSFSRSKLKKWSYPEWVTKINDDFKVAKAKAESTGEATYEEQDSLRFTMIKL